jgi:hypothetical protein
MRLSYSGLCLPAFNHSTAALVLPLEPRQMAPVAAIHDEADRARICHAHFSGHGSSLILRWQWSQPKNEGKTVTIQPVAPVAKR